MMRFFRGPLHEVHQCHRTCAKCSAFARNTTTLNTGSKIDSRKLHGVARRRTGGPRARRAFNGAHTDAVVVVVLVVLECEYDDEDVVVAPMMDDSRKKAATAASINQCRPSHTV